MFRERDFALKENTAENANDLLCDLGLDVILDEMAKGDSFLRDIAETALLASLTEPGAIRYRQDVLQDCLQHPDFVRELYTLTSDTLQQERSVWGWKSTRYPESTLQRSVDVLHIFVGQLRQLRHLLLEHTPSLNSEGFQQLGAMLSSELDEAYLSRLEDALRLLKFEHGIDLNAHIGNATDPVPCVLIKPELRPGRWLERLHAWVSGLSGPKPECFVYEIHERDEAGYQALSELRGRAIAPIAKVAAQAADHISGFFQMFRLELGFYIGCLNLHQTLAERREPTCLPTVHKVGKAVLSAKELYDPGLSLRSRTRLMGNDIEASGGRLLLITGANGGGKSTFLRSLGIAQLMLQAGMFVGATEFHATIASGVFTHFRRHEDQGLRSGKFDEELRRMDTIVDKLQADGLLLLNESFASTNEREGTEIASEIIGSLLHAGIHIAYVTHMMEFITTLPPSIAATTLFLHAELDRDGQPMFRMAAGGPNLESHGRNIYEQIFRVSEKTTENSVLGEVASCAQK